MPVGILFSEELREYDFGPGHPFRGDRYDIFPDFLRRCAPPTGYHVTRAPPADREDLLLICDEAYIDFTAEYFEAARLGLNFPGPFYRFHSEDNRPVGRPGRVEEAARLVVGQAKEACDLVQTGAYQKVVSIGGGLHHAKRSYGEGFCLYNDVAFSAIYLRRKYGLERVLILDTDAHAGNGTSDYFYEDNEVLFIDLHQDPHSLYPGTGFVSQIGSGKGKGFTVNVPLPPRAGYESYKLVFESIVEPLAYEFGPQVIVRNGGSDPHLNDPLTHLGLTVRGFRMIGERTRQLSALCGGKVVDLIASGYDMEALPYAWMALISGLTGIAPPLDEPEEIIDHLEAEALTATKIVISDVERELRPYWRCFAV